MFFFCVVRPPVAKLQIAVAIEGAGAEEVFEAALDERVALQIEEDIVRVCGWQRGEACARRRWLWGLHLVERPLFAYGGQLEGGLLVQA